MEYLARFINLAFELVIILVIVYVLLGYIFSGTDHPVRNFIAGIVEPMLVPIQKLLPRGGAIDFSPLVLILIIIFFQYLISAIFRSF
jgi:YggT family protein